MMKTAHLDSPMKPTPVTAGPESMNAVVQEAYGSASHDVLRLERVARPATGPDNVLVRVAAASVGSRHVAHHGRPPADLVRALGADRVIDYTRYTFIASEKTADLVVLRDLIEDGKVVPAIDRTYPLSEAAAAVSHMQDGRAGGKVVIAV